MDYIENGICDLGGLLPNPFQTTNIATCELIQEDNNGLVIDVGVCSDHTEELLTRDECGFYLLQQSNDIFNTITVLLSVMCNNEIVNELINNTAINPFNRQFYSNKRRKRQVAPFENVTEFGSTFYTNLRFGEFSF